MMIPASLASSIKKAREQVDLLEGSLETLSVGSERLTELRLAFLDDKERLLAHVAQYDEADEAARARITEECEQIAARLEEHCLQLTAAGQSYGRMLRRLSAAPAAAAALERSGAVALRTEALRQTLLRLETGPAGSYLRTKVR
jgi:chromosome segregation ATPase